MPNANKMLIDWNEIAQRKIDIAEMAMNILMQMEL